MAIYPCFVHISATISLWPPRARLNTQTRPASPGAEQSQPGYYATRQRSPTKNPPYFLSIKLLIDYKTRGLKKS